MEIEGIEDIELIQTSGACPEQYDAKVGGETVGYLRLRSGMFTVECPYVGGDLVYSAEPEGDGIFEGRERQPFLIAARWAIANYHKAKSLENVEASDLKAEATKAIDRLEHQASFACEDAYMVWEYAETIRAALARIPDELEAKDG